MNGLVGIQWGKVCVNLPVILGNMQAVGTDIVIELRLPSFAGVLPADEPDEVLHPGAGHSHHRHWQQSVLARVQGEVDIDLLGRCCAHVTLWTEHMREAKAQSSGHADPTGLRRLPSRTCALILWAQTN